MAPSIFNDVLGPVMRGPSSSHTAASWRIGRLATQMLGEPLAEALVEFDERGAWAPNYEEQGTVLGMTGGLLGIEITDARIVQGTRIGRDAGIGIGYRVSRFPTDHANTVRLTLTGREGRRLVLVAVSLGGGMIEIRMMDGHAVRLQGDWFELFGWAGSDGSGPSRSAVERHLRDDQALTWSETGSGCLFRVRSPNPFDPEVVEGLEALGGVDRVALVRPILPVVSGRERPFPFRTAADLLALGADAGDSLGELGIRYEAARSGLERAHVVRMMHDLVGIIESSIAAGLEGTEYADRILPRQSDRILRAESRGILPADGLVNRLVENVTAIMEAKSAMEVVVAAPTAGGCGTLGGTLKAVADARGSSDEAKIRAYFAAGLVGVFIAQGPGFSAEEGGCQLETGAAASMAAAALVDLCGGTAAQALAAASMALQNTIGLVCDPVADRVEVPCLGKNVTAGMNALAASTMALSGFDAVIPLDEVIETVKSVAATMPRSLCCTGLGGLAATPTSARIKEDLRRRCSC
jgi:L-serine dehydratase